MTDLKSLMSSCPSDCFDNKINVSRNELYLPLDPPLKKSGKSGFCKNIFYNII